MDLTPRLLTEVEFREQWRGYSQTDVDDFLKRVAGAVGELQEQLRAANERAAGAERRLLERSDDDEIRRTLVLAQRTAVTAVEEARAEAERILDDANRRAAELLAGAEAKLANLEAEIAEQAARELGELAERRAALQADVDALAAFQEEHRERLRAELQRQLAELDAPSSGAEALAVPEPPEVSEVDLSIPEPSLDVEIEPMEPLVAEAPSAEPFVPRAPTEEEVAQAREDLVEALRRAGVEDLLDVRSPEDLPPWEPPAYATDPEPESPRLYDAADESGELALAPPAPAPEATGVYDVLADDEDEDQASVQWREPEVAEAPPAPVADDDDDPFLAELRRAVTDTEPLGPRDDELPLAAGEHDDAVPSGRFRLRRGR